MTLDLNGETLILMAAFETADDIAALITHHCTHGVVDIPRRATGGPGSAAEIAPVR